MEIAVRMSDMISHHQPWTCEVAIPVRTKKRLTRKETTVKETLLWSSEKLQGAASRLRERRGCNLRQRDGERETGRQVGCAGGMVGKEGGARLLWDKHWP